VIETNSWHKGAKALEDGGELSNAMRAFDEQFPTEIAPELAKPGRIAALLPKGPKPQGPRVCERVGKPLRLY
jgi:hypothetical protein